MLAEDFGADVTTRAHFLAGKLGLDTELDAYETVSGKLIIRAATRFPPPDISQEIVYPDVAFEKEKNREKTRAKNTVLLHNEAKAIPD